MSSIFLQRFLARVQIRKKILFFYNNFIVIGAAVFIEYSLENFIIIDAAVFVGYFVRKIYITLRRPAYFYHRSFTLVCLLSGSFVPPIDDRCRHFAEGRNRGIART